MDLALSGPRYLIQNNNLHDNRARGLLVQSANGLVRGNTISNPTLNGAFLMASTPWLEGPGANNVTFTNNTIRRTGNNGGSKPVVLGAVSVYTATQAGNSVPPANQNINITGNSSDGSPGPGIFLSSTRGAMVLNNGIAHANQFTTYTTTYGSTNSTFPIVMTSAFNSGSFGNQFDTYPAGGPLGIDRSTIDVLEVQTSEDAYAGDAQFTGPERD